MSQPFLFFRAYGFAIILAVVFMLSFIWLGTRWTLEGNSNNVEEWLPESNEQTRVYKWFEKNFPAESFVVISWEDCKVATFEGVKHDEDKIELFAQKLVPEQTINNMGEWFNPQPLVAELDVSQVKERWIPPENGKNDPSDTTGTPAAMTGDVIPTESKTEEEKSNDDSQKSYFKSVLTYPRLKKILLQENPGMSDEEVNERLSGVLIGDDHASTALMAFLKEKPKGKEAEAVIAYVRQIAQELGIEPTREEVHRTWYQAAFDNFTTMVQEMVYGRQTGTSGVIIGGTPVDNASIAEEGTRTLYRLAGFCAVIGLGLAYLCFGSIRLTTFVFWTAILSAGISLALVSFTRSHCDTIMLSMPALVYILAMSASIHLINYYNDAIREGGLVGAPERAIKLGWFPCFIAALTTAFGLGSLYTSGLVPIQKFGIYSALGVMFTLVMIYLFLPAMLYFYPSKKYARKYGGKGLESEEHNSRILKFWHFAGDKIINNSNKVAILCLVVMLTFGCGLYFIKPEVKMMKFYSKDAPIIVNYTWLEKHIGPLVPMEVVLKFNNATCDLSTIQKLRLVDEVAWHLKQVDEVGGVISAATFAPSPWLPESRSMVARLQRVVEETTFSQKFDSKGRKQLRDYITTELADDPATGKPVTIDKLELPENVTALLKDNKIATIADLLKIPEGEGTERIPAEIIAPYREKAKAWEKAHGIDLWRISLRVWALGGDKRDGVIDTNDNIDYSVLIKQIQNDVAAILTPRNIIDTADPMGDNIKRAVVIDKLELPEHETLLLKTHGINDMTQLLNIPVGEGTGSLSAEMIAPYREKAEIWEKTHVAELKIDVGVAYTGMVPLVYQTQHELIKGLFKSLILAFVTIAMVFCMVLRNVRAGFLAMVPNVFPVMVVFGFMGCFGILVDVGTMMTASVAMAVAVDNTMHYLTWFGKGINAGLEPRDAALQAYERCATAMTQTTLICGFGLSAFAFSTFTPTQMFGKMMLSILLVSMIGDLIFLPAILTGPFGKYFVKKNPKGKDDSPSQDFSSSGETPWHEQQDEQGFAVSDATDAGGGQIRQSQAAHDTIARPNVLTDPSLLNDHDLAIRHER